MPLPTPHLISGLLLLVPILAWNAAFARRLPKSYNTDDNVPTWLRWAENGLRAIVFVGPLFIPLGVDATSQRTGLWLFGIGCMVYFVSWLPILLRPNATWARSLVGGLGPAYTPAIFLLGLAWIGRSWIYGVAAALFLVAHNAACYQRLAADGAQSGDRQSR